MKSIVVLIIALPVFIFGATLALLLNTHDSSAAMVIDPRQNPSVAFHMESGVGEQGRSIAASSASLPSTFQENCALRHRMLCWTVEKLPFDSALHLSKKNLEILAVFLFGIGLFGLSSFLRNIFRVD